MGQEPNPCNVQRPVGDGCDHYSASKATSRLHATRPGDRCIPHLSFFFFLPCTYITSTTPSSSVAPRPISLITPSGWSNFPQAHVYRTTVLDHIFSPKEYIYTYSSINYAHTAAPARTVGQSQGSAGAQLDGVVATAANQFVVPVVVTHMGGHAMPVQSDQCSAE